MGVPEADDHRRSLPGDTTGGPSQDTELGHGTRQQPLLDQGASHGSPGPALKQRQLGRNSRNLKGNYLCKTPDGSKVSGGRSDAMVLSLYEGLRAELLEVQHECESFCGRDLPLYHDLIWSPGWEGWEEKEYASFLEA